MACRNLGFDLVEKIEIRFHTLLFKLAMAARALAQTPAASLMSWPLTAPLF